MSLSDFLLLYSLYIAFLFGSGDTFVAPKCGTKVLIQRNGCTLNELNPESIKIFDIEWMMVDWWKNSVSGIYESLLIAKINKKQDSNIVVIDLAITVPVHVLMHQSHHTGFAEFEFEPLPKDELETVWNPNVPDKDGDIEL